MGSSICSICSQNNSTNNYQANLTNQYNSNIEINNFNNDYNKIGENVSDYSSKKKKQ